MSKSESNVSNLIREMKLLKKKHGMDGLREILTKQLAKLDSENDDETMSQDQNVSSTDNH